MIGALLNGPRNGVHSKLSSMAERVKFVTYRSNRGTSSIGHIFLLSLISAFALSIWIYLHINGFCFSHMTFHPDEYFIQKAFELGKERHSQQKIWKVIIGPDGRPKEIDTGKVGPKIDTLAEAYADNPGCCSVQTTITHMLTGEFSFLGNNSLLGPKHVEMCYGGVVSYWSLDNCGNYRGFYGTYFRQGETCIPRRK